MALFFRHFRRKWTDGGAQRWLSPSSPKFPLKLIDDRIGPKPERENLISLEARVNSFDTEAWSQQGISAFDAPLLSPSRSPTPASTTQAKWTARAVSGAGSVSASERATTTQLWGTCAWSLAARGSCECWATIWWEGSTPARLSTSIETSTSTLTSFSTLHRSPVYLTVSSKFSTYDIYEYVYVYVHVRTVHVHVDSTLLLKRSHLQLFVQCKFPRLSSYLTAGTLQRENCGMVQYFHVMAPRGRSAPRPRGESRAHWTRLLGQAFVAYSQVSPPGRRCAPLYE